MRKRLARDEGRAVSKMRKAVVESLFGQTEQGRGTSRFSDRGMVNVGWEWLLTCATHNLLKVLHSGKPLPSLAAA